MADSLFSSLESISEVREIDVQSEEISDTEIFKLQNEILKHSKMVEDYLNSSKANENTNSAKSLKYLFSLFKSELSVNLSLRKLLLDTRNKNDTVLNDVNRFLGILVDMGFQNVNDFDSVIEIIKSLLNRISKLETKRSKLQKKIKKGFQIEDAEYQMQIAQLNSENDKLKQEIEHIRNEFNNYKLNQFQFQQNSIPNQNLIQTQQELENMRVQLTQNSQIVQKLQEEKFKLNLQISELNSENTALKQKLTEQSTSPKIINDDNSKFEDEISQLKDIISKLETEKKDIIAENSTLKKKIDDMSNQTDYTNTKEISKFVKVIENNNNDQLLNEISHLKAMIEAQKQNKTDEKQISQLKSTIKDLQAQLSEKQTIINDNEKKYTDLQKNYDQYNSKMESISKEIETLKSKLTESKKKSSQKLKTLKNQYEELIKTQNLQNSQKLKSQKNEYEKKILNIKNEYENKLENQRKEYQDREESYRKSLNDAIQSQTAQKELIERELKFKVEELECENRTLRDQMRKLSYTLDQEEKELARLQVMNQRKYEQQTIYRKRNVRNQFYEFCEEEDYDL